MNFRDYKAFEAGEFYHVYNRGNGKQDIFLDDNDYDLFLSRLHENLFPASQAKSRGGLLGGRNQRKPLPADSFSLVCYCLMPNHFHLLLRQNSDTSISKLVSKVCTSYSKSFNKRYGHVGHLFQDQFKSAWVDRDEYLMWLVEYIHANPQKAGLVKHSNEWSWSSIQDLSRQADGTLCDHQIAETFLGVVAEGGKRVKTTEKAGILEIGPCPQDLLLDDE